MQPSMAALVGFARNARAPPIPAKIHPVKLSFDDSRTGNSAPVAASINDWNVRQLSPGVANQRSKNDSEPAPATSATPIRLVRKEAPMESYRMKIDRSRAKQRVHPNANKIKTLACLSKAISP